MIRNEKYRIVIVPNFCPPTHFKVCAVVKPCFQTIAVVSICSCPESRSEIAIILKSIAALFLTIWIIWRYQWCAKIKMSSARNLRDFFSSRKFAASLVMVTEAVFSMRFIYSKNLLWSWFFICHRYAFFFTLTFDTVLSKLTHEPWLFSFSLPSQIVCVSHAAPSSKPSCASLPCRPPHPQAPNAPTPGCRLTSQWASGGYSRHRAFSYYSCIFDTRHRSYSTVNRHCTLW